MKVEENSVNRIQKSTLNPFYPPTPLPPKLIYWTSKYNFKLYSLKEIFKKMRSQARDCGGIFIEHIPNAKS